MWPDIHIENILTQQQIEEKIKEYDTVPSKNFINESYFLCDKSGLIKESCITAINKKVSLFESTSYFDRKAENEILKLVLKTRLNF